MRQPATETITFPLLRTKLHRAELPHDLVQRPLLLAHLEQRRQRPLTLVSAPAGYGKTTLVSSWLEKSDWPGAWLSLDEDDNDLGMFLTYLVAAIQTLFPDSCEATLSLLAAPTLPPLRILARALINELDQINESFILVLDDYHLVTNMDVHELIGQLLARLPRPMHLVLASRVDPPLDLPRYRARGQLTEIRTHELRFSRTETEEFLRQKLPVPADDATTAALLEQVEGWVTGIRLVGLSLRHRGAVELGPDSLQGGKSYIVEYLMAEVLNSQPPAIQEYLLHTAILDRFCAPLCQAVVEKTEPEMDGERFIEWLETANLFVIRLDDQGQWYRYHHLFRDTLRGLLAQRLDSDDIAALHSRASVWLAQNGLVGESLHHALAAGDTARAVDLVAKNRHEVMNRERWQVLERWLNRLPRGAIEGKAELLLTKAWILQNRFGFDEMPPLLERIENRVESDAALTEKNRLILRGELAALHSVLHIFAGFGQLALENTRHALEVTPIEHGLVRGISKMYHALSYQLVGQLEKAYEEIQRTLAGGGALTHRAYLSLGGIEALAGNLSGLERAADLLLESAEPRRLYVSMGWALYSLGLVHYLRNELDKAKHDFERVVETRYRVHAGAAAQSYYGLSMTCQAMGKPAQAREVGQSALAWALEIGDAGLLLEAESLASHLALLRGEVPSAIRWAGLVGDAVPLMLMLRIPHLTLANVLLAQGTPGTLQKASNLLMLLHQSAQATHNTWRLMEIEAMQAVLSDAVGERQTALARLESVVAWAEPRGYVRLFSDLGSSMASLLEQLRRQGVAPEFVAQVLAAFPTLDNESLTTAEPTTSAVGPSSPLVDPLTNRELQILELLAQDLSNKEIAAQLVLALGTVKQYTHSTYQKLSVHNRRQAVRRAIDLGILPRSAE
jgi:LuxR family maltose regulon positive regulatory protein